MSRRALTEKRPLLLASLAFAIAYFFLRDAPVGGVWLILIKGGAVASLAIYALLRHPGPMAKLLTVMFAFAALGDMAMEIDFTWGGALFFASHLAALALYLQNPRRSARVSQKGAATMLLLFTPIISWLLTRDTSVTLYALALGGMAAAAWMSRFSRYRVGLGAVLFVISDLLIFADMGGRSFDGWGTWLVWPIYFAGQFLIATGVIQTLRHELPEAGAPG